MPQIQAPGPTHKAEGSHRSVNTGYVDQGSVLKQPTTLAVFVNLFTPYVYIVSQTLGFYLQISRTVNPLHLWAPQL